MNTETKRALEYMIDVGLDRLVADRSQNPRALALVVGELQRAVADGVVCEIAADNLDEYVHTWRFALRRRELKAIREDLERAGRGGTC